MDILCGECGSDDLVRDPDAPKSDDIPLLCRRCGWRGHRTPRIACRRCGSANVDQTPVDSWAYEDLEDARESPPTAAWGYLDKTVNRCRDCHYEWTTAGQYRPYEQKDEGLHVFQDDDAGYRSWVQAFPDGFVLNCERRPSRNYLILHRATCHSITDLQPGMSTFTGDYIEACSTDRSKVRDWATTQTGASPASCQLCM